jgi:hypothetical protein
VIVRPIRYVSAETQARDEHPVVQDFPFVVHIWDVSGDEVCRENIDVESLIAELSKIGIKID